MASYEQEEARLRQLMEEAFDEESVADVCDDQSDCDESDHEQQSDHDTDTEQEISDTEEAEYSEPLPYYKGINFKIYS